MCSPPHPPSHTSNIHTVHSLQDLIPPSPRRFPSQPPPLPHLLLVLLLVDAVQVRLLCLLHRVAHKVVLPTRARSVSRNRPLDDVPRTPAARYAKIAARCIASVKQSKKINIFTQCFKLHHGPLALNAPKIWADALDNGDYFVTMEFVGW